MKGHYYIKGASRQHHDLRVYVGKKGDAEAQERDMATMTPAEAYDLGFALIDSAKQAGIKIVNDRERWA